MFSSFFQYEVFVVFSCKRGISEEKNFRKIYAVNYSEEIYKYFIVFFSVL